MATTSPCAPPYTRRSPAISTAAPRRCTGMLSPPVRCPSASAAARQLARRILDLERPKLFDRFVDEAAIDQARFRELLGRHLVGHVPLVDVEHAGDVDLAVRASRRPRILFQQLAARRRLGADQLVDDL